MLRRFSGGHSCCANAGRVRVRSGAPATAHLLSQLAHPVSPAHVSEPQGAEDQALVRGRLVLPMKDPEIYT
eukprot:s3668_g3.t1